MIKKAKQTMKRFNSEKNANNYTRPEKIRQRFTKSFIVQGIGSTSGLTDPKQETLSGILMNPKSQKQNQQRSIRRLRMTLFKAGKSLLGVIPRKRAMPFMGLSPFIKSWIKKAMRRSRTFQPLTVFLKGTASLRKNKKKKATKNLKCIIPGFKLCIPDTFISWT
jgi:hypothetical protein